MERHQEAVAGRGAVAERHQEAAAGRGAEAELLAGAPGRSAIGKMLLAGAPWQLSCCWQRRRKAASGSYCWRGCLNGPLLL